LADRAAKNGAYFVNALKQVATEHPSLIREVRGMGLLIGVEFTDADIAALVIAGLFQRYILAAYTLNNPCVIRFEPPLIIEREQINQVVDAFSQALIDCSKLLSSLETAQSITHQT
ncbi:MAG TPA: aminotransferase class III-fold pyridoxal phosphate-dependent enzyme, partial [Armatimonadetes bacterium]|nr:aminotransferase class III-fold pyridoxal phosphate-dependent enzyme [Armatimonadota bacterium]